MQLEADTIVAIATPPGRGGIGMVRLSGAMSCSIARALLRLKEVRPGQARVARLHDGDGALLDEVVVTHFAAPRSYTGEDVVEIAAHGAPVLLEWLLRASVARGARLADPGEFTRRAVLCGRLDLTQAEAVHDLVAAQTLHQARTAAAQLGGGLAHAVVPAKQALLALIAELEAGVDFAEDDLEPIAAARLAPALETIAGPLRALAASYSTGRLVRDGFTLALVGRPNAGKSSLFNRLLDRERAIVTAQPGTTRDPLHERIAIGGIPVELIDTAGLREVAAGPAHEPERQGVARSRTALAEADLVLHVRDATLPADAEDFAVREALAGRPHLVLLNKRDLAPQAAEADALGVSARTGEGLEALRAAILHALAARPGEAALVTTLRQHQALAAAAAAVEHALGNAKLPHDLLLIDLYAALEALDGLTGATPQDEILDRIFRNFCIGK